MTTTPADSTEAFPEPPAVAALRGRFGGAVREVSHNRGQFRVLLERDVIVDAIRHLRDAPDLRFDFLADLSALDHYGADPRFRVFYVLRSLSRHEEVVLKIAVPEEDLWAPSLVPLFATANWLERECYDMFGIEFRGHPDLRRILMPEVFDDFPLRKDFPLPGRKSDQEWGEWVIAQAQREHGPPAGRMGESS